MVEFIAQSLARPKNNNLTAYLRDIGPGSLVAVSFIDPGDVAAGVVPDSARGYGLLRVVAAGTAHVIYLQRK